MSAIPLLRKLEPATLERISCAECVVSRADAGAPQERQRDDNHGSDRKQHAEQDPRAHEGEC